MKMMMKFCTEVKGPYQEILPQFRPETLKKFCKKVFKADLKRYDGHSPGDEFILEFNLPIISPKLPIVWHGQITSFSADHNEVSFVDEGLELPFGLTSWRHHHRFCKNGQDRSLIIDEVEYESRSTALALAFYPLMYAQFMMRKPLYKIFLKGGQKQKK